MALSNLKNAFSRLGLWGVFVLTIRKISKWTRFQKMLVSVPRNQSFAQLKNRPPLAPSKPLFADRDAILHKADSMLRDENIFFTFPYRTRGIERPWEFDPIENKYWPRGHYTERNLPREDVPRDVKIVYEINRFVDLPILGQAALLTGNEIYASEIERRMISWLEDNPFASSVNWSSALEISIRLISWTTSLLLLDEAGFQTCKHAKLMRSIFEQASYLAADLSTDKVVPSNHLIGEAAGLYIVATFWEFKKNMRYARQAKEILEREIIRQTYPDGVTREASSWYHQFVTHFFDLADRIAALEKQPFSKPFQKRLANLKGFLMAMMPFDHVERYGDADDGWALWMEGDLEEWKGHLFGAPPTDPEYPAPQYFSKAQVVVSHVDHSFLFIRAGTFGMGGSGSSSHAHDDFLSPILYLDGLAVLVDSGTFVYNGDSEKRSSYRVASAHNGLVIGNGTGASPRNSFGWLKTRPDATILKAVFSDVEAIVSGTYGEWPQHTRNIRIKRDSAIIEDHFSHPLHERSEWRFHLAPDWMFEYSQVENSGYTQYQFRDNRGNYLTILFRGAFDTIVIEPYDYSSSYLVSRPASMLRLNSTIPNGDYAIVMTIKLAT